MSIFTLNDLPEGSKVNEHKMDDEPFFPKEESSKVSSFRVEENSPMAPKQ